MSSALWSRDFDRMAEMMAFPHTIYLPETKRVIQSPEQQSVDAGAFRKSMQCLGATAFHRVCREAWFDPETRDRMEGLHTTYVLRGEFTSSIRSTAVCPCCERRWATGSRTGSPYRSTTRCSPIMRRKMSPRIRTGRNDERRGIPASPHPADRHIRPGLHARAVVRSGDIFFSERRPGLPGRNECLTRSLSIKPTST